jgi:aryl-alcohol dehydrogenase-like predicted oxidoreductase
VRKNVAARLNAKPMSVALAWLLQRSPNILLIPGTSSVEHLRENVAGAGLQLPDQAIEGIKRHRRLKRQINSAFFRSFAMGAGEIDG